MSATIQAFAFLGAGLFFVGGVLLLGMAVLDFFVAIVFSCMGVVFAIGGMFYTEMLVNNIVSLLLSAAMGGYLWFHPEAQQAFGK